LKTRRSKNDNATTDAPITTILASIEFFWVVLNRAFIWNNAKFSLSSEIFMSSYLMLARGLIGISSFITEM